jgi:hypothetical protein
MRQRDVLCMECVDAPGPCRVLGFFQSLPLKVGGVSKQRNHSSTFRTGAKKKLRAGKNPVPGYGSPDITRTNFLSS